MSSSIVSQSPIEPATTVATAPAATSGDIEHAVAEAERAAAEWRRTPAAARAAALDRLADGIARRGGDLADLITVEVGKPIAEARAEVARAEAIVRYQARGALAADGETFPPSQGSWLLTARRRPRGVCAIIAPWNFPLAIPLWKSAPAIAWGNAVIVKPASPAIGCAAVLAELAAAALPAAVLQIAPGGRSTAEHLIDHPGVRCVSFTGSVAAGRAVLARAAARGLPAQAEMGGQNPSIVLADADLDHAAETIAQAAMGFAGQKCTATSRVLVESAVAEAFEQRLVGAVRRLGVGDPRDDGVVVGPVISAEARAEALDAVAAAEERGAVVLAGGQDGGPGFVLQPTLARISTPDDPLAQEEVFAPVATLQHVDDLDDAIEIANGVRYGLSAAVFTRSLAAAARAADELEAGLLRVNQSTAGVDLHAPFGGVKDSSYGPREQGPHAHEFFTTVHTLAVAAA